MKSNHGGPNRGQGRKPISQSSPTITVSIRMTKAQREKLKDLGGAKWVRERIEVAIAYKRLEEAMK